MAEIGVAGQRPGADRYAFVFRIGGADQVVGGKPDRLLRIVVALDDDVAAHPTVRPGAFVRAEDRPPAGALGAIERRSHLRSHVFEAVITSRECRDAPKPHCLPRHGLPDPARLQVVLEVRQQVRSFQL